MGFASSALQVGGALSSGASAFYGAKSQKIQYGAAADVAAMNARLAELQAQGRLAAGQREEQKQRLATANVKAAQEVGFAANGIDIAGGGSPARVLASTDVMGEIDALTIRANSVASANEARTQVVNYENEARTARATAAGIDPGNALFQSLLGSATELSGKWYSMNKEGAFKDKPAILGGSTKKVS